MKVRSLILIFTLGFLFSCQLAPSLRSPASQGKSAPIDVVFDLDWTLIAQVKSPAGIAPQDLLRFEDEYYRLNPGAREILTDLLALENVRVSFFSGGAIERNLEVLSQVDLGGVSARDVAYKVLSRTDLSDFSTQVGPEARFSERYKKDLRLVNPDLSRVIMIEDNTNFALDKTQSQNFIWLGETYENIEVYSQAYAQKIEAKYRPDSFAQWLSSRLKLQIVGEILKENLPRSQAGIDFEKIQKEVSASGLQNSNWSALKSRLLQKSWPRHPANCQEHMELLLLARP